MERAEYLTLVLREANRLAEEHEERLRQALAEDGGLDACEELLDRQIAPVVVEIPHPEDLIKNSALAGDEGDKENEARLDPAIWKAADDWESVRTRVATCCLGHDVKIMTVKILRGEMPVSPSGSVRRESRKEADARAAARAETIHEKMRRAGEKQS